MNIAQKVLNKIGLSLKSASERVDTFTESTSQFFSTLIGNYNSSGAFLSPEAQREHYRSNSTFARVINKVIDGVVSLPIKSESDEDVVIDKEFLRASISDYLFGGCWVEPMAMSGFKNEPLKTILKAVRDDEMNIEFDRNNDPYFYVKSNGLGREFYNPNQDKFDPNAEGNQILHIFQSNPFVTKQESYNGVGNAASQGNILGAALNRDIAEDNFLKNKGVYGILSTDSNIPMRPDLEQLRDKEFKENLIGGADKFNGLHLSDKKVSFTKLSTDPNDLKLLETGTSHLRKIASVFNLDSIVFGDKTNSAFNNVESAKVSAYTECYIQIANEWLAQLNPYVGTDYKVYVDEIHALSIDRQLSNNAKIEVIKGIALTDLMDTDEAKRRIKKLLGDE